MIYSHYGVMVWIVDSSLEGYFTKELTRRNWKEGKLENFHFSVGDWAVFRITKQDVRDSVDSAHLQRRIEEFAKLPMRRLIILEGNVAEFLQRRSRRNFHLEFSINKYLNYSKILKDALVKYEINVIQTSSESMTLGILLELMDDAQPLEITFNQFNDLDFGLNRNKYFIIVTYLSAYYSRPFGELSAREIMEGLELVKMPGIGKKTVENLTNRLARVVERDISEYQEPHGESRT